MPADGGSARYASRSERELRREVLIEPVAELGLVAANGPNDPEPSLEIRDGAVVELDGRRPEEWDVIDQFVARWGIDPAVAEETAALDDAEIARRLVDVDTPRDDLVRLSRGLTPARLARIAGMLDPVELMFALKKLRARRAPANQAHVTNLKENPALLAADAAEAAARGFAEVETTVGVSRYAPLNALAILVGSQTGRPGVLTQCAVEERLNLRLAILGLVTYAETLSVYGTEAAFVDGDDTPWSKAFLASAYASRGVKVRFTSGGGSEALMGESEGKSMLYLESRCLSLVRAAGSQGVQNGSISCVALALAVPGGTREIMAENVLAAWLDLEVASGNDAIASHSEIRKTAKLMGQFLPGTDFVTSGYSVMPRYDNMFGGGNYDAHDLDEWLTIQRDWQVDAGIEPLAEADAIAVRERAARAVQAVYAELGFPPITDEEVALAARCLDSRDLPDRDRAADVLAGDRVLAEGIGGWTSPGLSHGAASTTWPPPSSTCSGSGSPPTTSRPRRSSGATAASSRRSTTRTTTGGRVPATASKGSAGSAYAGCRTRSTRGCSGSARQRRRRFPWPARPSAARGRTRSSSPWGRRSVRHCRRRSAGCRIATCSRRSARAYGRAAPSRGWFGSAARRMSRRSATTERSSRAPASRSALQSKGTALIHRADRQPLDCLELFGMAPSLTLDSYVQIGRNAAGYALGLPVSPVPTVLDNYARAKLIVRTTLLHARESAEVVSDAEAVTLDVTPTPVPTAS